MWNDGAHSGSIAAGPRGQGRWAWCALAAFLLLSCPGVWAQGDLQADLAITIDNDENYLFRGQYFIYTITVSNDGPDDIVGATVMGIFGPELKDVTWSTRVTGEAVSLLGAGTGDIDDTVDIPNGSSVIYAAVATVRVDATGQTTSTATVIAPAGVNDTNPANNSATDVVGIEPQDIVLARSVYANVWPSPNASAEPEATPPDNAVAAYNGHVGDRSAPPSEFDPNQPRYVLKSSLFGQPLSRYTASPNHVDSVLDRAISDLFYVSGAPDNNAAAFRYINTFFNIDTEGIVHAIEDRTGNSLSFDFAITDDGIENSDEERALRVADEIRSALMFDPFNSDLRNLLLDIYYYRTLGRQIVAKDKVVQAYQMNFSSVVSDTEPFGGPINKEIAAFQEAAEALSGVLDPYRDLLFDGMGVDLAEFDPAYEGGMPFGYYLFREEVPNRSVHAGTFVDFNAVSGELSGEPEPYPFDDAAVPSVLYVTPTGFNLDYKGRPAESEGGGEGEGEGEGESEETITFTLENVGGAPLSWTATVRNPRDDEGAELEMLSMEATSGEVPVGESSEVSVDVSRNRSSPTLRRGSVEIRDASPGGLTYTVSVTQGGNPKPIIWVSQDEVVVSRSDPSEWFQDFHITVLNAGNGTLKWKATLIDRWWLNWLVTITDHAVEDFDEWSFIPWELWWHRTIEREGPGVLSVRVASGLDEEYYPFIDGLRPGYEIVQTGVQFVEEEWFGSLLSPRNMIQIENTSDPEALLIYIPVYVRGDDPPAPPGAKSSDSARGPALSEKSAGTPLLAVHPNVITVGPNAVSREFSIQNTIDLTGVTATSSVPWIDVVWEDTESSFVALQIGENAAAGQRTGTVTVAAANSVPESLTVTVRQDGTGGVGIAVNPARRMVGHFAGEAQPGTGFEVTRVGSGVIAWTARVTKGQDWLTIVSGGSGQDEGEILFAYDENARIHGRTGVIRVEMSDSASGQAAIEVPVTQNGMDEAPTLAGGFKDLILLFDVLRDEANVKKELAKRYALRRAPGDIELAKALVAKTLAQHTAALSEVGGLIPEWRSMVPPNSQLTVTYTGWQQTVGELSFVRDFINGDMNVLGFEEDFLFLVQEFEGQSPDLFDSFDKLFEYMFDGENSTAVLTSPLGYAHDKFLTARAEYGNYLNTEDEVREEYRTQNLEHRKWMYDVVGIDPGNDVDNPESPEAYRNPSGNYGGEIWLIDRNIERAREGIRQNEAELNAIVGEIQTELWRRGQEEQVNATIADLHVTYGEQVASIEELLGHVEGAQAALAEIAEMTSLESLGPGMLVHLFNAGTFPGMEVAKASLEGQKTKLAALENQQIRQLEDYVLEANSEALIASLLGQAHVVAVQSADAALALIQEIATRQANIDEWHYRESQMRDNNAALLGKAFANPLHRMRMRRAMLEAEGAFKVAQRWVLYAMRALEYKWNTPFAHSNAAGDWSMDSLFRARTAKDLIDLMAAIRDFDGLLQGSARFDDRFDWFSFKKDFMGLTSVYDTDGVTELPVYAHPLTGYAATATEVFQARFEAAFDPDTGIIELPFSTFKDNGQTFFRGPRRDPNDPTIILSRGQYLDKIYWMKVNLLGDFSESSFDRVSGALSYSGGSYLRNAHVGTIPDLARPDVIVDEFTYWPTRFWFYDAGRPGADPPTPAGWRSSDEQTTEIALSLVGESGLEMPDSVSRIDVFRERSVACDGWLLRIFTYDLDGTPIVTADQFEDIEILFYHLSKDRPNTEKEEAGGPEDGSGAE